MSGFAQLTGNTRKELFGTLKIVLSERFANVPRPELIRDLLVPLKNALGNAWRHGNGSDPSKLIEVECVLSSKGALIAITDQGKGFDVERALRRMREADSNFPDRGAGFRNFERARSLISFENGGRTMLLCFRPEAATQELSMPGVNGFPSSPDGIWPPHVLDGEWMRQCLSAELPEFAKGDCILEACRVYPGFGCASDGCGIRYILQIRKPVAASAENRVLTGRVHSAEAGAEAEFTNATRLAGLPQSKQFRIPRAVARPAAEPRLVLFDFDPWLSLQEYLDDRGTDEVIRQCAERLGRTLPALHQTGLVHGALGFDSIRYGADGRFYLTRLENCRIADALLDLGGFLADLLIFTAQRSDEPAWRAGGTAFLGSYDSARGGETNPEALRASISLILSERGQAVTAVPDVISRCRRYLDAWVCRDR